MPAQTALQAIRILPVMRWNSMTTRTLVRTVSRRDLAFEYFRAGGKGGQHQNKTSSGCRCRHMESGAVVESREHKSQKANQRACLHKLAAHPQFLTWARIEVAKSLGKPTPEELVDRALRRTTDLKVEVRNERGQWVEVPWEAILPDAHVLVRMDGSVEVLTDE